MKKKISFIDVNYKQGPASSHAYWLPYSVATIWSYANENKKITDLFELDKIIWRRDNIDYTVEKLKNSDIIGFSTYIWNRHYNYTLANRIKKLYPHILIVFGGPEPPITKSDFFSTFPFIDIVVKNEGEIIFSEILLNFNNITTVKGLLINKNGQTIDTGHNDRIQNLNVLPSPFFSGIFEKIFDENPEIKWNSVLETNRGCPYACTFCDWGSLTNSKIKKYNLERVFSEITWVAKNKIESLYITDANFGIFPERDSEISKKLIEVNEKYGYPKILVCTYAKNPTKDVINIIKNFKDSKFDLQSFTISFQSLNQNVLKNIKRTNLEINKVAEIFKICNENKLNYTSELILGLPGETFSSWKNNFYELYKNENHMGIDVYISQLLENAELNLKQKKDFKIKTAHVYDFMNNNDFDPYKESIEITIGTKNLPTKKFREAIVYTSFLMSFHGSGLTTFISKFLNKKYKVSYKKFYENLFKFLQKDDFIKQQFCLVENIFSIWTKNINLNSEKEKVLIGNFQFRYSFIFYSLIISFFENEKINYVFNLIKQYIFEFYKEKVNFSMVEELIDFQYLSLINFNLLKQYPIVKNYNYDFYNFLQNNGCLDKKTQVIFSNEKYKNLSKDVFLEFFYFRRREKFSINNISVSL